MPSIQFSAVAHPKKGGNRLTVSLFQNCCFLKLQNLHAKLRNSAVRVVNSVSSIDPKDWGNKNVQGWRSIRAIKAMSRWNTGREADVMADLNLIRLLSVGSLWTRSMAMLSALALVNALKSTVSPVHGARNPSLKCAGPSVWFGCCASVVAMTTVTMTTSADVVISAVTREQMSSLIETNYLPNIRQRIKNINVWTLNMSITMQQ